ncbi:MAG: DUF5615 family PIN-like protein [Propionibacteriaceae bacterium]|jgi:predicted nuclease of predicted toxin-antitoxin system|nr:DUF5615 family PIN-like protein [Propionibacteriaceae bacterium]
MTERLLLDEHFSAEIAVILAGAGFDVRAVAAEPALKGRRDPDIVAYAAAEGYRIVTENVRDFLPLVASARAAGEPTPALLLVGSRHAPRGRGRTGAMAAALRAWLATAAGAPEEAWLSFDRRG